MRGETEAARSPEPGVRELRDGLTAGTEMDRYDAAYQLGATGSEGVEALMEALRQEGGRRVQANIERSHTNPAQFEAAYGLTVAGSAAVPALTELFSLCRTTINRRKRACTSTSAISPRVRHCRVSSITCRAAQ